MTFDDHVQQALMAMPEAGGASQVQGVHGFGGAGAGRFAGPGGMMGAGGNAQGEPLRVTIANPSAMKQNVRVSEEPLLMLFPDREPNVACPWPCQ